MGKSVNDIVLNAALNRIALGTILTVCTSEPTTRTQAITTFKLADQVIDGADFTNANGDISGRKVTIGIQENIPVDTSGTALHIAISDATDLLYVTTCVSQALTAGNNITIPAWKIEFSDPS